MTRFVTAEEFAEKGGIIIIDKPQEFTSFDVCAKMRGMLRTRKIGHAGTLDPMATGVLPVLVGKATRALELLPSQEKAYRASFRVGLRSTTQDIWGEITQECKVQYSRQEVEAALEHFRGDIMQIPPMYSALKVDGHKLCDLARKGIEVERQARPVHIKRLELLEWDGENGTIECECSKGTYIRTLVADLGDMLGGGAVVTALRRTYACSFTLEQSITLEKLQSLCDEGCAHNAAIAIECAFSHLPRANVTAPQSVRFRNGAVLSLERLHSSVAALEDGAHTAVWCGEQFLGLGIIRKAEGEMGTFRQF